MNDLPKPRRFRLQFSLAALMIAVFLVSAALTSALLISRSYERFQTAESHAAHVEFLKKNTQEAADYTASLELGDSRDRAEAELKEYHRWIEHYQMLEEKYYSASRTPWNRVDPDPPSPIREYKY